jgi:hypothetical protein
LDRGVLVRPRGVAHFTWMCLFLKLNAMTSLTFCPSAISLAVRGSLIMSRRRERSFGLRIKERVVAPFYAVF